MIIYSAPLHHPLLPSCTKSSPPGAGAHFRRHKNLSLSNHTAFQSLPMTARHEHLLPPLSAGSVDAIGSRIRNLAETEYGRTATGDFKPNSWTLLDFGDVVVHIFLPPQRDHYNLEEFYANATPIELPFQDQQPFRN